MSRPDRPQPTAGRSGAVASPGSVVFSGATRPCRALVDAATGAVLPIHETFPSPEVYAKKAGVPTAFVEHVVNRVHTSATLAGKVFACAGRTHVGDVAPHRVQPHRRWPGGPTGGRGSRPVASSGPTEVSGPPMTEPHAPPAWWVDALLAD